MIRRHEQVDWHFLSCCLALFFMGITALYSLSLAGRSGLFEKQLLFFIVGVGLCVVLFFRVSVSDWRRYAQRGFFITSVLLCLPFLDDKVNGAHRWFSLGGFSIQPSELFKAFLILCLARWAARAIDRRELGLSSFLHMSVPLLLPLILICLQPDFGMFVMLLAVVMVMFFLTGIHFRWIFILICLGGAVMTAMILSEPYRMQRLTGFWDPFADPYGQGYNQLHSLMAYGSGGLFGVGLGESVEKHHHLPEAHNDFIVAIIAEEWGLIGFIGICLLFLFLVARTIGIAQRAEARGEYFGALYAFGLSVIVSVQAVINIGGSLSLLPSKGCTLPLVSYGGSSLWATLLMFTVLLRLDYENRYALLARDGRHVRH